MGNRVQSVRVGKARQKISVNVVMNYAREYLTFAKKLYSFVLLAGCSTVYAFVQELT